MHRHQEQHLVSHNEPFHSMQTHPAIFGSSSVGASFASVTMPGSSSSQKHHHHHHHQGSSSSSSSQPKVKRTRQRVDAGEPRNSYASIANFSSRGGYHGYKYHGSQSQNHHHHQQHLQQQHSQHNQHSTSSAPPSLVSSSMSSGSQTTAHSHGTAQSTIHSHSSSSAAHNSQHLMHGQTSSLYPPRPSPMSSSSSAGSHFGGSGGGGVHHSQGSSAPNSTSYGSSGLGVNSSRSLPPHPPPTGLMQMDHPTLYQLYQMNAILGGGGGPTNGAQSNGGAPLNCPSQSSSSMTNTNAMSSSKKFDVPNDFLSHQAFLSQQNQSSLALPSMSQQPQPQSQPQLQPPTSSSQQSQHSQHQSGLHHSPQINSIASLNNASIGSHNTNTNGANNGEDIAMAMVLEYMKMNALQATNVTSPSPNNTTPTLEMMQMMMAAAASTPNSPEAMLLREILQNASKSSNGGGPMSRDNNDQDQESQAHLLLGGVQSSVADATSGLMSANFLLDSLFEAAAAASAGTVTGSGSVGGLKREDNDEQEEHEDTVEEKMRDRQQEHDRRTRASRRMGATPSTPPSRPTSATQPASTQPQSQQLTMMKSSSGEVLASSMSSAVSSLSSSSSGSLSSTATTADVGEANHCESADSISGVDGDGVDVLHSTTAIHISSTCADDDEDENEDDEQEEEEEEANGGEVKSDRNVVTGLSERNGAVSIAHIDLQVSNKEEHLSSHSSAGHNSRNTELSNGTTGKSVPSQQQPQQSQQQQHPSSQHTLSGVSCEARSPFNNDLSNPTVASNSSTFANSTIQNFETFDEDNDSVEDNDDIEDDHCAIVSGDNQLDEQLDQQLSSVERSFDDEQSIDNEYRRTDRNKMLLVPSQQTHQSSGVSAAAAAAAAAGITSPLASPLSQDGDTGAFTPPTSNHFDQDDSDDDDSPMINNVEVTLGDAQPVNGCKKRKLYQPQQRDDFIASEDDDDEMNDDEEDNDDDDDEDIVKRSSSSPITPIHHHPMVTPEPLNKPKELDLSVKRSPRTEHLPVKRARVAEYERENGFKYSTLQQQQQMLIQQHQQQMFAAQQHAQRLMAAAAAMEQAKALQNSAQFAHRLAAQSPGMLDCDIVKSHHNHQNTTTTGSQAPTSGALNQQQQPQQQPSSQQTANQHGINFENLKNHVLISVTSVIEQFFRGLEKQQQQQPLAASIAAAAAAAAGEQRHMKPTGNELLAQMLDGKYNRASIKANGGATSLLNNNHNSATNQTTPASNNHSNSGQHKSQQFGRPESVSSPFYGFKNYGFGTNVNSTTPTNDSTVCMSPVSALLLQEQTEAMSLVKKPKRNKVTDARVAAAAAARAAAGVRNRDDVSSLSPPAQAFAPLASNLFGPGSGQQQTPAFGADALFADAASAAFSFNDQARLMFAAATGVGVNDDADDMKNPVVNAVAQAAAAHHLQMLAASRGSADYSSLRGSSFYGGVGSGSTGSENGGDGSEMNDTNSVYDPNGPMTATLSPVHLRKAKLMFFYVRYPSSSILKTFFPDIRFNKNNTAQLVKWFSNFREFYYIQMEKYARQALSEGITVAEELSVTDDCELLRVLNLHYNRSNQIPIPENFRMVCETTLREFFRALQLQKDTEQSWKKAIYKVIARLDDNVPEYFKNPNFMDQLE